MLPFFKMYTCSQNIDQICKIARVFQWKQKKRFKRDENIQNKTEICKASGTDAEFCKMSSIVHYSSSETQGFCSNWYQHDNILRGLINLLNFRKYVSEKLGKFRCTRWSMVDLWNVPCGKKMCELRAAELLLVLCLYVKRDLRRSFACMFATKDAFSQRFNVTCVLT